MVIGVDVGGTKIAAAAVARDCSLSGAVSLPTPHGGAALLDAVAEAVSSLSQRFGAPKAVGVGLPSLIRQSDGTVLLTANADLAGISARTELEDRIGVPVALDNDANVAAIAEHRRGAGRGTDSLVMLTLGTGVGGGVIVDGRPMRGGEGRGAELGHMTIDPDGPRCQGNCPNRGCLETLVSGTAISRDTGVAAEEVVAAARAGDSESARVLERAGQYLGIGIASLANIFSPDIFVIGGGLGAAAADLLIPPATVEYRRRTLPPNALAPIFGALLGPEAGVVGAGLIAWDWIDDRD